MKKTMWIIGALLLLVACGPSESEPVVETAPPTEEPVVEPTELPTVEPEASDVGTDPALDGDLLIPDANQLSSGRLVPVQIEGLGMQAVVPNSWPPIEDNAVLRYAWGINQLNFLAFDSEPGDDALVVLEEWVGIPSSEMNDAEVGFVLREEVVNDREWAIFERENEETGFYAFVGVTVVEGEAYLMALFAPQQAGPELSQTILESVNILD